MDTQAFLWDFVSLMNHVSGNWHPEFEGSRLQQQEQLVVTRTSILCLGTCIVDHLTSSLLEAIESYTQFIP